MDVDVAVLGGGPGGYTAAIRVAQLGAKVACIEKEPELGGTCLRVGCIPTKAWVQTAFALKEAEESFAKFGVRVGEATLDFAASNAWKAGVVKQVTQAVAGLFKANGVEWVKGSGRFKGANTIAVEGGEDVSFKQAIIATGSFPLRPPIEGLDSPRCVDSTGLLALEWLPQRLVVLGGGIIGCEFASIFHRFRTEVTIIEMLDKLIPQEDDDAAKELAKQFGKRGIALQLGKQGTKVEDDGSQLTLHGDDVAVGRFPWVANARAVMQDETVGWVKSIHETRYGELLGLVMVGPHVTDLIEAGVVAIDAESTVETVADGMTAHPTLSEAIKEAGLVALGRAIHIPNKKARATAPA